MEDECWHVVKLAKHCRVCGKRLQKGKTRSSTYACTEKKEELELTFGITVDDQRSSSLTLLWLLLPEDKENNRRHQKG